MVAAGHRTGIHVDTTLNDVIDAFKQQGATVGFVFGRFETIHPGNLHMLRMAADKCDVLIVGFWDDMAFHTTYGRQPLFPEIERAVLIGFYKMVSAVVAYHPDYLYKLIENINPDKIFVQQGDPFFLPQGATYKLYHVKTYKDYSSENTYQRIRQGGFHFDNTLQMWGYDMKDLGMPCIYMKTLKELLAHLKQAFNLEF